MAGAAIGVGNGDDLAMLIVHDLKPNDIRVTGEYEPADVVGLDGAGLGGRFDLRLRIPELLDEPASCPGTPPVIPKLRLPNGIKSQPVIINDPSGH
jgi:hypothetical protein